MVEGSVWIFLQDPESRRYTKKQTHTPTRGLHALRQPGLLTETLGRDVTRTKINRHRCYNYHFLLKFSGIIFPPTRTILKPAWLMYSIHINYCLTAKIPFCLSNKPESPQENLSFQPHSAAQSAQGINWSHWSIIRQDLQHPIPQIFLLRSECELHLRGKRPAGSPDFARETSSY